MYTHRYKIYIKRGTLNFGRNLFSYRHFQHFGIAEPRRLKNPINFKFVYMA